MPPDQVKYFTDSGEDIRTLEDELASGQIPLQAAMFDHHDRPWPAVVFVLGGLSLFLLFILGIVSILHG